MTRVIIRAIIKTVPRGKKTKMSSKEVIKKLKKDNWFLVRVTGDHYQFRHPTKKGTVTVPHPHKDLPKGTLNSIFKQAGWK